MGWDELGEMGEMEKGLGRDREGVGFGWKGRMTLGDWGCVIWD